MNHPATMRSTRNPVTPARPENTRAPGRKQFNCSAPLRAAVLREHASPHLTSVLHSPRVAWPGSTLKISSRELLSDAKCSPHLQESNRPDRRRRSITRTEMCEHTVSHRSARRQTEASQSNKPTESKDPIARTETRGIVYMVRRQLRHHRSNRSFLRWDDHRFDRARSAGRRQPRLWGRICAGSTPWLDSFSLGNVRTSSSCWIGRSRPGILIARLLWRAGRGPLRCLQ